MGILSRLFGSKSEHSGGTRTEAEPPVVCVHLVLAPQWDAATDMGHEERAARWVCAACAESFTPVQYAALRASEVERVHALMDAGGSTGEGN